MTWRGSTTIRDKFFSALSYLLPWAAGISFGGFLFKDFPFLLLLQIPVLPLLLLYGLIPFGSIIVFFLLLFLVVRNERIPHFIRFNVMQAILLDIALVIVNLLFELLGLLFGPIFQQAINLGGIFLLATIFNVIFLGSLIAVGYGIFQSAMGLYPDKIPTVSDVTYVQVR